MPDPQAQSTFADRSSTGRSRDRSTTQRCWTFTGSWRGCAGTGPNSPILGSGAPRSSYDDDERWLSSTGPGLRIAANFSDQHRTLPLGGPVGSVLVQTQPGVSVDGEQLSIPGHTAVVLAPDGE